MGGGNEAIQTHRILLAVDMGADELSGLRGGGTMAEMGIEGDELAALRDAGVC